MLIKKIQPIGPVTPEGAVCWSVLCHEERQDQGWQAPGQHDWQLEEEKKVLSLSENCRYKIPLIVV